MRRADLGTFLAGWPLKKYMYELITGEFKMHTVLSKLSFMALMLGSVIVLGACNTVEGVGEDVEKAGETLEEASHSGYND